MPKEIYYVFLIYSIAQGQRFLQKLRCVLGQLTSQLSLGIIIMAVLDITPHNLRPVPTFSANAGGNVPHLYQGFP